ncbi:MAG: isoprenylcysteine carboxylmethyltransferase family protein [Deltaproteobacteria bacterium]|nr:isoprenylcysteine carboxylmethyltransferase family protein [Deltaproteobacteria bacterium]
MRMRFRESIINFVYRKATHLKPPPALADTGPYAYVRNPMMSGMLITLFGVGVFLKSISLSLVFTPVLFAFVIIELKAVEKPELEKRLGEVYLEYKKRVPMFFSFPMFKIKGNLSIVSIYTERQSYF